MHAAVICLLSGAALEERGLRWRDRKAKIANRESAGLSCGNLVMIVNYLGSISPHWSRPLRRNSF